MVIVVVVVGLVCVVIFIPFSSKEVDIAVAVETASLVRFSLDRNALDYALALNLTWSNNGSFVVRYNELRAKETRNTSTVSVEFKGQTRMADEAAETYSREKVDGNYEFNVEVDARLWKEKNNRKEEVLEAEAISAVVDCWINVALMSNSSSPRAFERTQCRVKF
ncbi:unnamed protein product [Spirodela intermedia]|uniref:Uncharacterized protein n=1 Tax=Spirodela intermedia TaxID=51605 RepID=A0A7I8IR85_SPIIN|nr:unnamed protein product [Spirodela intermedia]CAA6660490.1 unnamed protein product [Spirodela intermedia]